ncbi:unnamed protein product [Prunus brigantina]
MSNVLGGFDKRLKEDAEYLKELRSLAEKVGVSNQVNFITSCSTAERNALLSQCLCVLYTPKTRRWHREFCLAIAKLIEDPQMAQRMGIHARRHVTDSFSTKISGWHLNQYLVNVAGMKEG